MCVYFEITMSPCQKIKNKLEELRLKYKKKYWFVGRGSALSIENKLMLYEQILKPVKTYGLQLCGCTRQSSTDIFQRFQNQILKNIVDAPWYIRNADLHSRDLQMEMVTNEIGKFAKKHKERLHHVNVEAISCSTTVNWCEDFKKAFELV